MLRSVFLKTFHDQRGGLLGWLAAIALIVLMYAAIWPSVRNQPSLNDYLDQLPEAFRSLFAATGADMSTPVGYIQIELMSFLGPIVVILYAVGQGSRAVAGEEERRTMDLLLAVPVSRTRVLLEKTAAMVVGTLGLAAATGATLVVEGRLFDMVIPVDRVGAAMLHLALLGLVFGALALAIGAATGSTGLSRGVPQWSLSWRTWSTGSGRWWSGSGRSRRSRPSTSTSRTTRCAPASRPRRPPWPSPPSSC